MKDEPLEHYLSLGWTHTASPEVKSADQNLQPLKSSLVRLPGTESFYVKYGSVTGRLQPNNHLVIISGGIKSLMFKKILIFGGNNVSLAAQFIRL